MARKVSIVIVNFNQANLTLACISSIVEHTTSCEYEIIVVDNASDANEAEILARASHQFKIVHLERNMFFGEPSNIGAELASGDLVLFLNNDIKVTPRWIEPLIATLETGYCAGAVGAKILHPNNELLEAGGVVRPDGWGIQIGKHRMKLPAEFIDATRITDYCSGACLLMRRQVFLDLGGFDPIFDPAYFEDIDLAIRLRSIGLYSYYCGASVVYHEESATSTRIWSVEERGGYIAENHRRLMQRWGGYLNQRIFHDVEPEPLRAIVWEQEAVRTSPKYGAVLYSSSPLKVDGSSQILLRAAAALQGCCGVVVATPETSSRCRIYSLCREFDIALKSFSIRRMADIDQASCQLLVTFGVAIDEAFSVPHLAFEQDGLQLLPLIDHLLAQD